MSANSILGSLRARLCYKDKPLQEHPRKETEAQGATIASLLQGDKKLQLPGTGSALLADVLCEGGKWSYLFTATPQPAVTEWGLNGCAAPLSYFRMPAPKVQ